MATPRTPPTSRGALLPEARHVVLPEGIVSSGFPAVAATCAKIGIEFDPWQVDLNRCILTKDAHEVYAADTVVISISRQVGKTFDVGALVFADCIISAGTTTVWTAHRFKVARETFDSLRAMAKSPLLAPHIDYDSITTAAGNECIPFRNGSRIVFAARERGAVRGFAKVRRLILDEAQILTESALADMVPTMNQAENPQVVLMGTPPKPKDPSEVFSNLRRDALAGTAEGVLYVEFSADPDADAHDRAQWRKANPSYPKRTPAKAILRMLKLLGEEDFRREGLGIWDASETLRVISGATWAARVLADPKIDGPVAYGVDMNPDRTVAAIGVAARSGERVHVEVAKHGSCLAGTRWVVDWLADRVGPAVVIDARSPAAALIPDLRVRGVEVTITGAQQMAQACGAFYDLATAEPLTPDAPFLLSHFDQPLLNAALAGARKRGISGEGGWGWDRRGGTDITPLVAVTLASWGLTAKAKKPRTGRAVFA